MEFQEHYLSEVQNMASEEKLEQVLSSMKENKVALIGTCALSPVCHLKSNEQIFIKLPSAHMNARTLPSSPRFVAIGSFQPEHRSWENMAAAVSAATRSLPWGYPTGRGHVLLIVFIECCSGHRFSAFPLRPSLNLLVRFFGFQFCPRSPFSASLLLERPACLCQARP